MLAFIPPLALLGMLSTYIGQLVRAAAAPLILHMRTFIGGVANAIIRTLQYEPRPTNEPLSIFFGMNKP